MAAARCHVAVIILTVDQPGHSNSEESINIDAGKLLIMLNQGLASAHKDIPVHLGVTV